MNFNDAHGLAMAFGLAVWERTAFATGTRKMRYDAEPYPGSMLLDTFGASCCCGHNDEDVHEDKAEPESLVPVLERVIRLQTVKCSPRNAQRSNPTRAMFSRCPRHLLSDEMAIARPAAILAFGRAAQGALGSLDEFHRNSRSEVAIGYLVGQHFKAKVFALGHPARPSSWNPSHDRLKRYIRRHGLQIAPP